MMTVEEYIRKLTLEEKVILLQGASMWTTHSVPRLRLPSVFLADGPHGLRKQEGSADHLGLGASVPATCFPTAAAMANSWDQELGQRLGRALGEEAVANDVHVVLGPGLNMKRSPLCGRNFEYFSEDPYLAGKMAAAYIRGIQSNGIAACPKHFAVNSQELQRMSVDEVVDERTLREIYLTGFEIAVREGRPKAIMSSYNRLNGTYANENPHLLTRILREEWGFDGFVVTDWGADNDHAAGVLAGSNLVMPNPGYDTAIRLYNAVKEGQVPQQVLDQRLKELLSVVLEVHAGAARGEKTFDRDAHHRLAQECAAGAIALLDNDGILPLKKNTKVAIIGEFAENPRYQGAGSSKVNPTKVENLKDALQKEELEIIGYAPGYRRDTRQPDHELIQQAVDLAGSAEVVLLCVGLDEVLESEGVDRQHMNLPANQLALIDSLCQNSRNLVLVLSGGSPFHLPDRNNYRAAIHGYLGGQAGSAAMAEALVGKVNPAGHLAETWPLELGDTPASRYYPGSRKTAQHREGLYIGYRYYDTAGVKVRYPFGHGLSYTTFAWSDLKAERSKVTFTLTNTGTRDGAAVPQVYITCRNGKIFRPKKELKGFAKVFLKAGESKQVVIALDDKAFRYFNPQTNRWETETANYEVMVAASVSDVKLTATIRVMGTEGPAPWGSLPGYESGHVENVADEEFEALLGRPIPADAWAEELEMEDPLGRLKDAKSRFARFLHKFLARRVAASQSAGEPDLMVLMIFNLPLRALPKLSKGLVTGQMAQDLQYAFNGHTFRGLGRCICSFFRGQKETRAFKKRLEYGPTDIEE